MVKEEGFPPSLPLANSDPPKPLAASVPELIGKPSFDVGDADFEILPDDDDTARAKSPPERQLSPSRSSSPMRDLLRPQSPSSPMQRRIFPFRAPQSPTKGRSTAFISKHENEAKGHRRSQTHLSDAGFRSPLARPFRALRARTMASQRANVATTAAGDTNLTIDNWARDDGSSSDELSDNDMTSSDDDSIAYDDVIGDQGEFNDFDEIPSMPNSFLDLPPELYDYLDVELVKTIDQQNMRSFAHEHHLLTKALMQLLAERDAIGVEDNIHDSSNVIKMGPLKKRSGRGLWLVKYVEIRKGNLSYFSDHIKKSGSMHRKTLHLRERTCRCESTGEAEDFMFDLVIQGRPKVQFLAQSDDERQGWIRAINQSLIGETGRSEDHPVDLSLYETAIGAYRSVQAALEQAESRETYLQAVHALLYRMNTSSALRIPMQWIRKEVINRSVDLEMKDSPPDLVKSTIAENWKYLSNTPIEINGSLIEANSPYAAERVVGTLTRCILEFDKVDNTGDRNEHRHVKHQRKDLFISEVEAVSYARSIMIGSLRSEKDGHILEAVRSLLQNDAIVKVQMTEASPLQIDISFANDETFDQEQKPYDISGWVATNTGNGKAPWKNRFFLVDEGLLSFFAESEPRPYGLKGQIVLNECTMKAQDDSTLVIETQDGDRLLRFFDRSELLKWRSVLDRAAQKETIDSQEESERGSKRGLRSTPLRAAKGRGVKVGQRAMKAMKGAQRAGIKKARGVIAGLRQRGQGSTEDDRRNTTEAMLMMSTRGFTVDNDTKSDPTVHAVSERNCIFHVTSLEGSEDAEPLLVIQAKLYQAFLMSGGTNGRIYRGDELIEMEFAGTEEMEHEFLETTTSL